MENASQYAAIRLRSTEPAMRLNALVQSQGKFVELAGERKHIVYFGRRPDAVDEPAENE